LGRFWEGKGTGRASTWPPSKNAATASGLSSTTATSDSHDRSKPAADANVKVTKQFDLSALIKKDITIPCRLNLTIATVEDFSIVLANDLDEKLIIGYNKELNQFFIDRTSSGNVGFQKDFAAKHTAPRLAKSSDINLSLILDESSAELFADEGLSVMTEIFFPGKPYNHLKIETGKSVVFQKIQYIGMESIWP
jgi:fructan beta-fructosidase